VMKTGQTFNQVRLIRFNELVHGRKTPTFKSPYNGKFVGIALARPVFSTWMIPPYGVSVPIFLRNLACFV